MRNLAKLSHFPILAFLFLTAVQAFPRTVQAQGPAAVTVTPAAPGNKILFETIRSGDAAALEILLAKGADANDTLEGYSALMAAALNGSTDQMKLLIAHGAMVNYMDPDGLTALWFSVPDWDKTTLLLDHGANPQLLSKEKYTVLVKLAHFPGTLPLFSPADRQRSRPEKKRPGQYATLQCGFQWRHRRPRPADP